MRRVKTIYLIAAVLAGLVQSVMAYSLGGPIGNAGDAWQVQDIGFGLGGDLNAPKNLGEEYRQNTPVIYYAYDQTFSDYFGSSGVDSIDKGFAILNQAFTNSTLGVDGYSADLSEIPLETRHLNYTALALGIVDLKSQILSLMTEHLGLTDPIRYAWVLHDRYLPNGGTCPADMEYLVVQRNFDPVPSSYTSTQYSAYVNNILYSYSIYEDCSTTPEPEAETQVFSVDPLADAYSPVAASMSTTVAWWGNYFTGLTRDDIGGLRYLLHTNNVNYEDLPTDALVYTITTNLDNWGVFPPYLTSATNFLGTNGVGYYVFTSANGTNGATGTNGFFGYGDYTAFLAFARTNSKAAVEAAYPGVVISSSSSQFTRVAIPSYSAYFTNPVGSVFGAPPILVLVTNYTTNFLALYTHQFANVYTNQLLFPTHYTPKGTALNIKATVGTPVGSYFGAPAVTNYTVSTMTVTNADFFVLPLFYTNYCPLAFASTNADMSIVEVLAITNGMAFALTNTSTTNFTSVYYTVTYFTNYSYVVYPTTCSTSQQPDYYQGIGQIRFVKVPITNYDTALGQLVVPVTNNYTMISRDITNGTLHVQYLQRIITVPDILISAADMSPKPGAVPKAVIGDRTIGFDQNHILTTVKGNLAGPGTLIGKDSIVWNKSGPVYYNTPSDTMYGYRYFTELPQWTSTNLFWTYYFVLGSFDGTTNAPTVFASGQSIENLQQQMLVQISPTSVPNGTSGVDYGSVSFTASGGGLAGTLTWSASGLPDGLSISADGVLSGTPTSGSGIYDFILTVTDSNNLSVQWSYTITIE